MKKVLLILQLVMSTVLYAQKKTDITDGYIIWETEDFKKYTPIIKCSLKTHGLILTSQMTDDGIGFVLTEGKEMPTDFNYYFFFYDFKKQNETPIYVIKHQELNRDIKCAYYSDGIIFSLEVTKNNPEECFITKRTLNSPMIIEEFKIDTFFSPHNYQYAKTLYVDEDNDRVLCVYSKHIDDKHVQKFLTILSFSSGKELFCCKTDLSNIILDGKKVYLSEKNKLFKINYQDTTFEPTEIMTFIPEKETIIAMQKNNDIYVVRTEYWKFNLALKFIFGNNSQIWSYYACKFQDEKLQKIKKLKEPKK